MTVNYDELSKQVLDLDTQVRFAGVANSKGVMIAGGHKENIEKMLEEFSLSQNNLESCFSIECKAFLR